MMKSYQQLLSEYTPAEIAESFVFPDTRSAREQAAAMKAFRIARKSMAKQDVTEDEVQLALIRE